MELEFDTAPHVLRYKDETYAGSVDWNQREWQTWQDNEGREIFELIEYDELNAPGESEEVDWKPEWSGTAASWPNLDERWDELEIPAWLEEIEAKYAVLDSQDAVLAPEEVLATVG